MLKKILSVVFLITLCCCEIDTEISIDGNNPPKFRMSGSGNLFFFRVIEVSENYKSPEDVKVLWQLEPTEKIKTKDVYELPEIEYGKIPPDFTQTIPKQGNPSTLIEGKQYSAAAMTYNANGGAIDFFIKDGKSFVVGIEK